MSDFKLNSKSIIKERQLAFLSAFHARQLPKDASEEAIAALVRDVETQYNKQKGEPLFNARPAYRHQLPYREDVQANMEEIKEDIHILSDEQHQNALFLKDSFNAVQSEKKRLSARIDGLNNLVSDLLLLSDEENENVVYLKESFNRTESLDETFAIDSISKAAIQTQEGILTLGRHEAKNLALGARIVHVSGNGDSGVGHLARRIQTLDRNGKEIDSYHFMNEENAELHTEKENILDDRPDTLFEYQRVNVPEAFKRDRQYYNFDWAKGSQDNDPLRLKLVVELEEEATLNWLTLHPYYANNNTGKIIVRSIKTSTNGFEYSPLYEGKAELNQVINATPQTYRLDDVFSGSNTPESGRYSGKGVWSFPQRQARFIEFVIDQPQSYPELIGQAVYTLRTDENSYPLQVPEPEELKHADPGEYRRTVDGERVIYKKEIQATREGWRYSIGLRDIKLMQERYDRQSHFISKPYALPRDVQKLTLYAKEIIPKNYLDIISKNNDWVRYEVSFDDSDWHRISPMHHEPLSEDFPPKIIEVNQQAIDVSNAFAVHKARVDAKNPKQVRLRITLKRPEDTGFEYTTPIIEEVALKVEMKGEV